MADIGGSERFGGASSTEIDKLIESTRPSATKKNKSSVWNQFRLFCNQRGHVLSSETPVEEIAIILKDWAVNMRRADGEEYKEYSVKTMWNTTAKLLQETYEQEYNRKFNPFWDIEFLEARNARSAKRKELKKLPEKRKINAVALKCDRYNAMIATCNECTPLGLQMKFFHIASLKLAWRLGEGVNCLTHHFKEELQDDGTPTGRIAYNPAFSKLCQDIDKNLKDTKWLISDEENPDKCPVRLYKVLLEKRSEQLTTDRFFLTPDQFYQKSGVWYKDSPVGQSEMSKWITICARKAGLYTKKKKAKNSIQPSVILHTSRSSFVPYVKMNEKHRSLLKKVTNETSSLKQNNVVPVSKISTPEPTFQNSDFLFVGVQSDPQVVTGDLGEGPESPSNLNVASIKQEPLDIKEESHSPNPEINSKAGTQDTVCMPAHQICGNDDSSGSKKIISESENSVVNTETCDMEIQKMKSDLSQEFEAMLDKVTSVNKLRVIRNMLENLNQLLN